MIMNMSVTAITYIYCEYY